MLKSTSRIFKESIPTEVWHELLRYFSVEECLTLRTVCRSFKNIVESDLRWKAYFNSHKSFEECTNMLGDIQKLLVAQATASSTTEILHYVKKDFSHFAVTPYQTKTYQTLIRSCHTLFLGLESRDDSLDNHPNNIAILELLRALCSKFLERMQHYFPHNIGIPSTDEISNAMTVMRHIDNSERGLLFRNIDKLLFFKQNTNTLPIFLLSYSLYKYLYNSVSALDQFISDEHLIDVDNMTPEQYTKIADPEVSLLIKRAICFMALEKGDFNQVLSLKVIGENLNMQYLNNMIAQMKSAQLVHWSSTLEALGVEANLLSSLLKNSNEFCL